MKGFILWFKISNKDETENSYGEEPKIITKNWYETCYIKDEFDTHEIYYELKAVGLPDNMFFNS